MTTLSRILGTLTVTALNPISFTHHGVVGQPTMVRGVDAEGRPLRTVFLPSAQLRGRIRHEAAIAEMLRGGKVKLETAYMLALGQDLRPEEDVEEEVVRLKEQLTLREGKPLLDLFGTWKMASRLKMAHLLPAQNAAVDRFRYIRRDLDSNEDIMELLGEEEQDRFYDRQGKQSMASKAEGMIKVATRELMAAKRAKDVAKAEAIEAKLTELKEQKKSHKGDDDSENSKHLVEVEAIPAGLELAGRIVIERARPRDLAILTEAFQRISLKPTFGAHTARGCGEVQGSVTFTDPDGDVLLVLGFGGYKPATVQWTDAGRAYVESEAAVTA